ncbi:SMC-Scp complex subunit ScpB [Fervidibacter sacchari]|uniref:Segregation and condensation protein B n=1 Tax=Candidatus Fervidibacter sacchari TaxID=1448929 RepID=A0ABT2ERB4_9BACT|nr:SMC-Scp complex subunit ScpB [Candidatus Fervidibacter sacchari]MCS3919976.1 segregation and condensation protein B [Candidatus Fervidibacter sacchari]WKU16789.1 SMC-Scp complex subunit ScpB [Candidatus Fervidibacter sacchari]
MEKPFNQPTDEQTREQLKKALECVLFVATKPLPLEEVARILQVPLDEALMLLNELAVEYERRSGLAIVEVAGGWRMVTRPEFAPYIARLHPPQRIRLSRGSLEVLAIIAYHQPITRPEIEQLRGVDSSAAIQSLLEHGLIQVVGYKETVGRPRLYATTPKFLELFGLRSLDELPPLREWQEQAAKLLAEARNEESKEETSEES